MTLSGSALRHLFRFLLVFKTTCTFMHIKILLLWLYIHDSQLLHHLVVVTSQSRSFMSICLYLVMLISGTFAQPGLLILHYMVSEFIASHVVALFGFIPQVSESLQHCPFSWALSSFMRGASSTFLDCIIIEVFYFCQNYFIWFSLINNLT